MSWSVVVRCSFPHRCVSLCSSFIRCSFKLTSFPLLVVRCFPRHSTDIWPVAVGGALVVKLAAQLINLRTLHIDCLDAEPARDAVSFASLTHLRRLRRLTLRHVRLSDVDALESLALTKLDLKHAHDIDQLLCGALTPALATCVALEELVVDNRPVRPTLACSAMLEPCTAAFGATLRTLSFTFHRLTASFGAVSSLVALELLDLSGCDIECDLGCLRPLTRLATLDLYAAQTRDVESTLAAIGRLTSLRSMMLCDGVVDSHLHVKQDNIFIVFNERTISKHQTASGAADEAVGSVQRQRNADG